MTMTDGSNGASRSGALSLSSDAKASGVGIQILRGTNDSVASHGPDSSQSNNPDPWFIGQHGNDAVMIPFKARTPDRIAGDIGSGEWSRYVRDALPVITTSCSWPRHSQQSALPPLADNDLKILGLSNEDEFSEKMAAMAAFLEGQRILRASYRIPGKPTAAKAGHGP